MADDGSKPAVPAASATPLDPLAAAAALRGTEDARATASGLGLSARLLLLTALFVMLAEVLIFVPSVANFRVNWLNDRLMAARLAALSTEATPTGEVPEAVRMALLSLAQVKAVAVKRQDVRRLVLPPDAPLEVEADFDLRSTMRTGFVEEFVARLSLIGDALSVYVRPSDRFIRVKGKPELTMVDNDTSLEFVEIVIPESMLRAAMMRYGLNILGLSIMISMIAAALLYLVLNRLLVMPILKLADNMVRFSARPEDQTRIIMPSKRQDEIGTAERQLAEMQKELSQLLHQKSRLAQLGLAVSKINHDLRNMLASAQLLSDRLSEISDPGVQRFAPKLIASLDRAIAFCNDTIRFGRAEEAPPRRETISLASLVMDVADGLGLPRDDVAFEAAIDPGLTIDADRSQLYRVLNNLVRNSLQVLETRGGPGRIRVIGRRDGRKVSIEVVDDGPGLPPRAKANLFQAFQGGARKGGTGLGLAIAAELVQAHGGTIRLVDATKGTVFRIEIPDR